MPQPSAQRFARHQGTGRIWDANDVIAADREGPWECIVDGCPVIYSSHRRPSQRFRGTTPDQVSGSFVIRGDIRHDVNLAHDRIPSRSAGGHRDNESRRNIHRLSGLVQPPVATPAVTNGVPSGAIRTQFEYGYPIDTVEGMVSFARAVDANPELAISDRIRFHDTNYSWDEIAYTPDGPSFARLFNRIGTQVGRDRVYFVEGIAKYAPYVDNIHAELLLLRLLSGLEADDELWVFMPNQPQFISMTSGLIAGQRVAILSNELVLRRHRPALMLHRPDQLKVVPHV